MGDFASGKELFDFIKVRHQNNAGVKTEAIAAITASVSSALAHCHQNEVCHRDLKPENIIVQGGYTAKLVDFGCACSRFKLQTQCVGTMPFISPECLTNTATDGAPADVWSLGVVVLEMRFGLRAMTRAMGWENHLPPMAECAAQLSLWFVKPADGL